MAKDSPAVQDRVERTLAYTVAGIVALSLVCFIAIIVGTAAGMRQEDFDGAWSVVSLFPLIGLPLGMLLLIALLVISARRRGRDARNARK